MSNHHEDEEIRNLLKSFRAKRPPEDLLKNYEQEVLRKIHTPGRGIPAAGAFALAACGVGLLALGLGVVLISSRMQAARPAPETVSLEAIARQDLTPAAVPSETSPPVSPQEINPAAEAAELSEDDTAARDLLILEMLGEDEGLVDGFDRMAADSEFWTPPAAGSIAS